MKYFVAASLPVPESLFLFFCCVFGDRDYILDVIFEF